MAARTGVERMARLGYGTIPPRAGVAALGAYLIKLDRGLTIRATLASVFLWSR